jgi:HdeA/HdeB family protein
VAFFLVLPSSHAQVTIDMGKVTCRQFLRYSVADPDKIAIWLSGYQHGKRGDVTMALQELNENVAKLRSACYQTDNAQQPVLLVVEKLFFAK